MNLIKIFYILLISIFSTIVAAQAAVDRNTLIQRAMDCTASQLQHGSAISWSDVCDVSADTDLDRTRAINQEMNQVEENLQDQRPSSILVPQQKLTAVNVSFPKTTVKNNSFQDPTQQNSMAEEIPQESQKVSKISGWSYEIAPEISSIKYVEHVGGTTFMKEKGDMYGINADITFRPLAGDMLKSEFIDVYRLEGMFTLGKVNYYGGDQNSETGAVTPESFDGIKDYMWELRGLIGKDYYFNDRKTRLTPYFGGGYRYLYDTMYENKPYGYNRRIQYFYLPAGADVKTRLINGWSLETDAEYDFFIRGFVTSYLEVLPEEGEVTNTQKSGYGLRGSVKILKDFDHFSLFFEPFVRFWDIKKSRDAASQPFLINGVPYYYPDAGYEPKNTSLEIGGKMGVEF